MINCYESQGHGLPGCTAADSALRRASDLEAIFACCFSARHRTELRGGAREPLYLPAQRDDERNRIYYRDDFFASALHEVAHWCIAGELRRRKVDYGYWYAPDGRDALAQKRFERVERKPQALEWLFSIAAGVRFRVSMDNLDIVEASQRREQERCFAKQVLQQTQRYCDQGLPTRAWQFIVALDDYYAALPGPVSVSQLQDIVVDAHPEHVGGAGY